MAEGPPLAGIRVVERTTGLAGGYAGFLLAALGAHVIRLEAGARDRGAHVLHRGKASARLDDRLWRSLVAGADVALTDESAPEPTADGNRISARVTLWGRDGHPAGLPPVEALVAAHTGIAAMQWSWAHRPVWLVTPMVSYMTGLLGALGVAAALLARRRGAPGQRIEADGLHAAMALQSGTYVRGPGQQGSLSQHGDPRGVYPNYSLYPAADGWLFVGALTQIFWVRFATAMGREDLLADERLQGHPFTFGAPAVRDFVRTELDPLFRARPLAHWLETLRAADIPCGPVRTRADALRDPEARALGLVVPLDDPVLGPTWQPGAPFAFSGTPAPAPVPAAVPGADTNRVRAEAPAGGEPAGSAGRHAPPLDGLRVLDLTSFIAGPFCPLLLAELGADVIKVESPEGDPFRMALYAFVGWNRGKRSLALDLKHPGAGAVLLDLARGADAVVDNFRAGVMERLGIGWEALRTASARLVHTSITGFGQEGPLATLPGFDPVFQARTGLMAAQGGAESPVFHMVAYNDYMAGALGALATTAALFARERTGRGQRVDVSLFRTSYVAQAADLLLRGDEGPPATGGADHLGPTAGERLYACRDGWVCVAARTDRERLALGRLGGVTLDAATPATGGAADAIARALAPLPRVAALEVLASAGVPAAPCTVFDEVFTDPLLRARGAIVTGNHPTMGPLEEAGALLALEATPAVRRRSSPLLGADGADVLREAGYGEERITSLLEAGIVRAP